MGAGDERQLKTAPAQVSIVVPTCNRRDALAKLLPSLSRQTGVEVQLVVVVEGSVDGTLDMLADCGHPNLEIVHHLKPRGVSAARNAGLARADAEYVGFVDDDDFWSPTRARDAIKAMQSHAHGAAWSSCGAANIDGEMRVTGLQPAPFPETVSTDLYRRNCLPGGGSAIVARTELLRAAGGFSSEFADLADWDLWLRLIRLSPLAVVDLYQIAYTSNIRTVSHTSVSRSIEEMAHLRAKHEFGVAGHADIDPRVWNGWLSGHYWRARDRSSLSRLWLREARRTRSPLDWGRAICFRVLPMKAQFRLHGVRLRRSNRRLDPVDVQEVQRWLADVSGVRSLATSSFGSRSD